MADETPTAPVFPVSASPDAMVGENTDVRKVDAQVEDRTDDALLSDKPPEPVTEVPVYEVSVVTDERVRYVIVPPEGRGDATLPIHQFVGAKTVEEVFAEEAAKADDSGDEEPDVAPAPTAPRA